MKGFVLRAYPKIRKALFGRACVPAALLCTAAALLMLYRSLPELRTAPETTGGVLGLQVTGTLTEVSQTFVARADGLAGVSVKLTPQNAQQKAMTPVFELHDGQGGVLYTAPVSLQEVDASRSTLIPFAPVPNSKGKHFSIVLRFSGFSAGGETGTLLHVADPGGEGVLRVNGAKREKELVFSSCYRSSRMGALYSGRRPAAYMSVVLCVSGVSIFLCFLLVWRTARFGVGGR